MNVRQTLASYINGEFSDSGSYFDNIDPVNGSLICKVAEASKEQVDTAVSSARLALKSEWGAMSVLDRSTDSGDNSATFADSQLHHTE